MIQNDRRHEFRPAAGEIPTSPGVYRFADKYGRVLYIGKAKNLRNRLNNYFQPLERLAPRTRQMLSLAAAVTWTVVGTDTESLILEHTWITHFKPPYNVQFKDDKTYPYLAVTLGDEAPRLLVTRDDRIKNAKYFGPYPKVGAVHQAVELLLQAFPIRACKDSDYKQAMRSGRPCLLGQINKCHGPCSGKTTISEHKARVAELVRFLSAQNATLLKTLETQMQNAAAAQEYEKAAELRDKLFAAKHVFEQNAVVLGAETNADFFGLVADELAAAVHQFIVRDGRIRGERSWIVDAQPEDNAGGLIEQVALAAYNDRHPAPAEIYVSHKPHDLSTLQDALREFRPRKGTVKIHLPERGDKAKLLETACNNARERLQRHKLKRAADIQTRTDALAALQSGLQMTEAPLRIECIDVSHLSGTGVVASLVVFEDGLPAKAEYRKYRIENTTDDTDSIYQVVSRRAAQLNRDAQALAALRAEELAADAHSKAGMYRERPQLLLVDGGEPQVKAAAKALKENNITDIALAGIAKRLEEVWLPDDDFPVIFPRTSDALFLIQRIRDEAHRFAITYQKTVRSRGVKTRLQEIPGLGLKRANLLLKQFGSVKRLQAATLEEIADVPGIGKVLAQTIYSALRDEGK